MLRDRNARRRLLTFIVLVVLSALMLSISGSAPVQEVRNGVRFAMAPVQDALGDGTRSVTSVLEAISEVDTLRRENDELSAEVERLGEQLDLIESLQEENDRLNKVLGTRNALGKKDIRTVAAGVSARHFTQFERKITIDRGSEARIREGAPVISDGGALLGRVTDVGEGWADVMLISDPEFLVAGLDRPTEATGNVIGRLSAPLAMTDIKRTDRVREKDLVVTLGARIGGGFRSVYPKGLPIGRVIEILDDPSTIVKTALIVPTADLEHIENVLVMTNFRPPRQSGDDESDA
ncbi:MAG: rod shape-determining protein MreC [Chloroflexota bacterium]|jgi:rod shape-determining protein MreC